MAYGEEQEAGTPAPKDEDQKILRSARLRLKDCIDNESEERSKMKDDLRFAALDQWPADIRADREGDIENGPRPCLTIDKYSQYRTQVVNDMRQGKPGINVRPQDDAGDIEAAKILKGLIRNIEDQSKADIAYMTGGGSAVDIGLGYFRITTEYVSDDSFDQEIFVRPIQNTFAVYLGPHEMPDGSDAEYGYICEAVPVDKFKELYPKAKVDTRDFDEIDADIRAHWRADKTITVAEEFCIEREAFEILFLADGRTISAADYATIKEPKPAVSDRRTSYKKQLKWRKMTAVEVLDKRDLKGQYIPIVEVVGREAWVDGKRRLWGLVRPTKDSLRNYNYWASTLTEKVGLAPKTPHIVALGQLEGNLADRWKQANRKNFPYLEYKSISDDSGNALPAPQRQGATPMEAAYFHHMQVIEHDVQTSLGMFKASVGETESQQSGRAILALQRESDTGTYHFGANLGLSIRHAGRIIVDMIPHYYDSKRIVRILGEDGEMQSVQIDPNAQSSYQPVQGQPFKAIFNPGLGKYDVSITVGPSYNTKRMEAAATYVELAKGSADPASAAVLRYLTVKNSDFSGADEAAKMLRALLPPAVADAAGSDPVPKLMARMQQMGAQMQQMQEQGQKLQDENMKLRSGVQEAQIKVQAEAQVEAMRINVERGLEQMRLQAEARDAEMQRRLAEAEARREADFERWKALLEARTDIQVAHIDAAADVRIAASKPAPERPS